MQFSFLSFLFLIATFIGFLIFIALFFVNISQRHSSRILAVYVLVFALFAAHNLLVVTNIMKDYPYTFRCTKALTYLPGILVYLYVRSIVNNEHQFKKWDFLFFVPAILHFIELLPFYFTSSIVKQMQVQAFFRDMNTGLKNNEGILPAYIHPILILIITFLALIYSYKLLRTAKKCWLLKKHTPQTTLYNWLNLLVSINALLLLTLAFHFFTIKKFSNYNIFLFNLIETSCLLIIIGISLFFKPAILYGINQPNLSHQYKAQKDEDLKIAIEKNDSKAPPLISDEKRLQYLTIIEDKMTQDKPFLQPGFTINDLGILTSIPYTYLSGIINQSYNLNFNEFVNRFRIDYVKALLSSPEANLFTLEAISQKAGFSSRATFSRAFLKFENCSPKEYIRKNTFHRVSN